MQNGRMDRALARNWASPEELNPVRVCVYSERERGQPRSAAGRSACSPSPQGNSWEWLRLTFENEAGPQDRISRENVRPRKRVDLDPASSQIAHQMKLRLTQGFGLVVVFEPESVKIGNQPNRRFVRDIPEACDHGRSPRIKECSRQPYDSVAGNFSHAGAACAQEH